MTKPTLFDCYRANRRDGRTAPALALRLARSDFERGRLPYTAPRGPIGHGDVIRAKGRTFVIAVVPDSDMGPPWEEHDGHGPVSDWTSRDKEPGELILNQERGSRRFYDFAAACDIARRDGWNAEPLNVPGETPRQRAAKAARADFERLRAWCNDSWQWVGVCLFELPRDGVERSASHVADSAPFGILAHWALWGIESDSPDYHAEVARELLHDAI